jgi:hypothetical protein
MFECTVCNNKGYIYNAEDKLVLCPCKSRFNWDKYLRPVIGFIQSSNKSSINLSELSNYNQVITNTAENIAGLMSIMLKNWFPEDYAVTTLEELNAIGFRRHNIFKSVQDFASNFRFFIVDITIINSIRAKSPALTGKDSMFLLDLVKTIIPTCKKIVIIIKPSITGFARYYQELCNGLNDMGIKYFHAGEYKKIPVKNDFVGECNE